MAKAKAKVQLELLPSEKAVLAPLRRIVDAKPVEQWVTAYLLECGHAYSIRGKKTPKRLRCAECRKERRNERQMR